MASSIPYHPDLITDRSIWIFDLDNTLYPAESDLFAQIDVKMTEYIANHFQIDKASAREKQKHYLVTYGATMRGLMENDGIDPHHFLENVHDIDFSPIQKDVLLREAIEKLPGRKLIYTNADVTYTDNVLERLGLLNLFEGVHDILASNLTPKPSIPAFDDFLSCYDIDPAKAVFFEDSIRNLIPAKKAGMGCVWIDTGCEWAGMEYQNDIAHAEIKLLSPWLQKFTDRL
ncbi:pyrimidine 5'-nucleotidase [Temperatibacter marinus]|uniref:Pyrimidine 5'-nucleotidase n=1 Tax=Temperatibacter marinus TaxID=1456591 RepID=A0AA52EEU4_9PROT|nr:pyrimidine 5'-nucleotidase [Temperatibacter marinus]WND03420.1 pyrimidine 5'-nucleotidase [Temperatibacter marinus]